MLLLGCNAWNITFLSVLGYLGFCAAILTESWQQPTFLTCAFVLIITTRTWCDKRDQDNVEYKYHLQVLYTCTIFISLFGFSLLGKVAVFCNQLYKQI